VLLRFLNFYGSQQKSCCAVGNRLRVRGELRKGVFCSLRPWFTLVRIVQEGGDLWRTALTPVYPTTAGLPQAYLAQGGGVQSAVERGRPLDRD
jgi:ATP-dependent DNA helicase RecG